MTTYLVQATEQFPDILIWKNDTISINSSLLFSHPNFDRLDFFGGKKPANSTACGRGYIAEWKIINNELYLSNIYSCDYSDNNIKSDLSKLFPNEFKNGMVRADWYNDKLYIPNGKLISREHKIYESEWELKIRNGEIKGSKLIDNSHFYKSIYTQNNDSLRNFIIKNVNWNNIPTLEKGLHKVYGIISSGKSRTDFKIKIKSATKNKDLEKEAMRILKSLPEFDFYFYRGEVFKVRYIIPIILQESDRTE